MSKRMQILVEEGEYERLQKAALSKGLTLAEWVRQELRAACRRISGADPDRKLDSIRAAARFSYPTSDIDVMLDEIESGYGGAIEE